MSPSHHHVSLLTYTFPPLTTPRTSLHTILTLPATLSHISCTLPSTAQSADINNLSCNSLSFSFSLLHFTVSIPVLQLFTFSTLQFMSITTSLCCPSIHSELLCNSYSHSWR